jgi:hypothetical protein
VLLYKQLALFVDVEKVFTEAELGATVFWYCHLHPPMTKAAKKAALEDFVEPLYPQKDQWKVRKSFLESFLNDPTVFAVDTLSMAEGASSKVLKFYAKRLELVLLIVCFF